MQASLRCHSVAVEPVAAEACEEQLSIGAFRETEHDMVAIITSEVMSTWRDGQWGTELLDADECSPGDLVGGQGDLMRPVTVQGRLG